MVGTYGEVSLLGGYRAEIASHALGDGMGGVGYEQDVNVERQVCS
jgi:hypothetical protein